MLAHENTKTRMAEPHDSAVLGLHVPASPADALPQQTFSTSQKLQANGASEVSSKAANGFPRNLGFFLTFLVVLKQDLLPFSGEGKHSG
jgi:hypothetical protein